MVRFRLAGLIVLPMMVAAACSPASADLKIGDKAPGLSIMEWVKGASVDLKRDAKKKIHVVEFWAVWCPPCKMSVPVLTELQKKFKKDLVIIGVTEPDAGRNTPSAVRRFVKERGDEMGYTVALDTGKTTEAYMVASGAVGIPQAYVVDREGHIVWMGSPLEAALGDVIERLVAGTFDVATAKVEQEVNQRLDQLNMLAQMGQWRNVWDGLRDVLKIDPANDFAMEALRDIATQELEDAEAFKSWVNEHLKANRSHAGAMRTLAHTLWGTDDPRNRFPDLALQAARAAYDAGKQREATSIAIYARALYHIGDIDQAIALQQDAVAVAIDSQRDEIRGTLDYYRQCKALQATVK